MSVVAPVLFTKNKLETGTVTFTSAVAAFPGTRVYDRSRSEQWNATSTAQQRVTRDAGAGDPISAFGIANHNLTGVAVTIQTSPDNAAMTPVTGSPFTINADPFIVTFPTATDRWQIVQIPNTVSAAALVGEIFLGVQNALALGPTASQSRRALVGNIRRAETPGGKPYKVRTGAQRIKMVYSWQAMSDADLAIFATAFGEIHDSLDNFFLVDPYDGTAHFVEILEPVVEWQNNGAARNAITVTFQDVG